MSINYFIIIRTFIALSNDQSFSCFYWKNCLPFLSQMRHSTLIDRLATRRSATLIGLLEININIRLLKTTP